MARDAVLDQLRRDLCVRKFRKKVIGFVLIIIAILIMWRMAPICASYIAQHPLVL